MHMVQPLLETLLDLPGLISISPLFSFLYFSPSLYQTGFILSWNIWNGQYRTLHYMDVTEYTQTKQSTNTVSSIEATRTLRKETAIPTSYRSQIRVFSNHTVFSLQSLKYLVHPFLPIVLVM